MKMAAGPKTASAPHRLRCENASRLKYHHRPRRVRRRRHTDVWQYCTWVIAAERRIQAASAKVEAQLRLPGQLRRQGSVVRAETGNEAG